MNDQQLNLQERLVRYNGKALADENTPFCSGKQQLDMALLQGKKPEDLKKLSSPVRGQPVFFDPLNSQLEHVKDRRKEIDAELSAEYKAKDFQDSIAEIPKIAYHPATLLTQMQHNNVSLKQISRLAKTKGDVWKEEDFFSPEKGESVGSSINSRAGAKPSRINAAITTSTAHSPQFDAMGQVLPEASLQLAMLKAKSGDTRSLYNLFMAADPNYNPVASSRLENGNGNGNGHGSSMDDLQNGGSLANSDFNFTNMDGSLALDSLEGGEMSSSLLLQITDKASSNSEEKKSGSAGEYKDDEEGKSGPIAYESKDRYNDESEEGKEEVQAAFTPPGSAPKPARIASPPRSAQSSAAHTPPGSAPKLQMSPPGSAASLKSAMKSPPGSAPRSAAGSSRPGSAAFAVPEVEADKPSSAAASAPEEVASGAPEPTPIAPITLKVEVEKEEQDTSKVSSEITSAFFGDNAPDFQGMTLAEVQDDASIDKEEDRTSQQRPGMR